MLMISNSEVTAPKFLIFYNYQGQLWVIKLKIRLRPVFLQMFPVKVPVGSAVLCDMECKYKHLLIWRFLAGSLRIGNWEVESTGS